MKKITATIACIIILLNVEAQQKVFIGIEAGTAGVGLSAGLMVSSVEIKAGVNTPLLKADVPTVKYASIGKHIFLSSEQEDSWSIVPSVGFGIATVKDFSKYDSEGTITKIQKGKIKWGIELGKDAHVGRFFIAANHQGFTFYNIGIRANF